MRYKFFVYPIIWTCDIIKFFVILLIIMPAAMYLSGMNLLLMDIHNAKDSFARLQEITVIRMMNYWLL